MTLAPRTPSRAAQSAAMLPWLQENPGNRLLQLRSNAGTHDLPLAKQTLQQLISAGASGDAVPVVRYDKSKNEGKGDRAPRSDWPQVRSLKRVSRQGCCPQQMQNHLPHVLCILSWAEHCTSYLGRF